MKRLVSQVRSPVRRQGADTYLLVSLLSFAASVSLTRLFLYLTGYPQVGNAELHIAHVLWGGLILFVAALLPLVLANRWVYTTGAVLGGVGVGLFIDEVGKFITQSNDYFYPAAAPIVYALFLLVVLLYTRIRRPGRRSPRVELYRAFEDLQELLDRDLDADERAELEARLKYVVDQSESSELSHLAERLLETVSDRALKLAPDRPTLVERLQARWEAIEARWFGQRVLKMVLVLGLALIGGLALYHTRPLIEPTRAASRLEQLILVGRIGSSTGLAWYTARLAMEGCIGLIVWVSAGLFIAGKDRAAVGLAYLGVLLALTTVDLLVFYFEQFGTTLKALGEFAVLIGVMRYRARFLAGSSHAPSDAPDS